MESVNITLQQPSAAETVVIRPPETHRRAQPLGPITYTDTETLFVRTQGEYLGGWDGTVPDDHDEDSDYEREREERRREMMLMRVPAASQSQPRASARLPPSSTTATTATTTSAAAAQLPPSRLLSTQPLSHLSSVATATLSVSPSLRQPSPQHQQTRGRTSGVS
jgi:hypothetical protein